jgi:hypothetical protein
VSTPSAAAAAAAAAPSTETSSIKLIPTQPELPLRRSSRKTHCSYPIPKTKRKMKTPAKTLAASSAGAPTKSIASASSISAARKRHPSGPSSVSKRSLEFGNKTQPRSPKQLEQYNELFSSTKWQDINELICEQTGEKTKSDLITSDHADLPEVSLLNDSVEAPMKETEPELEDEDSLLDFIDCKPELREESSGVNFSDISLDGVDFGSALG